MSEYPEHEKMQAVKAESQAQGEFLDWLANVKGLTLCRLSDEPGYHDRLVPAYETIERLLAEYHDIDLDAIEAEKRAMLADARDQQA